MLSEPVNVSTMISPNRISDSRSIGFNALRVPATSADYVTPRMIAPIMPRLMAVVIAAMLCLAIGCGDSKSPAQPITGKSAGGILPDRRPHVGDWRDVDVSSDDRRRDVRPAGHPVQTDRQRNASCGDRVARRRRQCEWLLADGRADDGRVGARGDSDELHPRRQCACGISRTAAGPGASTANIARARQLVELLRGLGYVDMNRIALHGHSMGAFVTAGVLGAYPDLFRAASHTAGGTGRTAFQARRRRIRRRRRFARRISFITATATMSWHCHPTSGSRLFFSVMALCTSCTCTWGRSRRPESEHGDVGPGARWDTSKGIF